MAQYTIGRLQTNTTYGIRIRAQFHYSEYCISQSFRRAQWSTQVSTTTVDTGILKYYMKDDVLAVIRGEPE